MDFLCIEFANSSWYINHKTFSDPLMDNEWPVKFADKWDIGPLPSPGREDREALIKMRNQLSLLFAALIDGNSLTREAIDLLNSYMADTSFRRQLYSENGRLELQDVPETSSWSWFMAEVAASFSRLCSSNAVNNLKECQNPECKWLFIDESKSRNRKWCDDACSSLMKVRRFRQKEKHK